MVQLIVAEVKSHAQASHSDIVDLECSDFSPTVLLSSTGIFLEGFVSSSFSVLLLVYIIQCSFAQHCEGLEHCPEAHSVFFRRCAPGTCGVASLELLPFCSWGCRPSMHFCPYEGWFCFLAVEYLVSYLSILAFCVVGDKGQ